MTCFIPCSLTSVSERNIGGNWHNCSVLRAVRNPETFTKNDSRCFRFISNSVRRITNENYTALVPFYGHLKNRLFRDEIFFVMFPIYSQTRKRDVITDNYFYPFYDVRHGDGMHGWQFWPLVGTEHKDVTTQTNGFGEIETVAGYDKSFVLWPVHFYQNTGLGTDDPAKFRADLPFYSTLRSPQRDATSVLWPFFAWIDDREGKYHEWEGPYPFVVVARGAGKTSTRVWPLFSRAHDDTMESDYYLWPLYRMTVSTPARWITGAPTSCSICSRM